MPLVLVVEPQAPAWAQQIVRFLQSGELPEEPEEAEKVARQSSMYQFVDNALYRRRLNGVKLKCTPRKMDRSCWQRYMEAFVVTTLAQERLPAKHSGRASFGRQPSRMQLHK